jgi:putative phosphoribosyl transferase
MFQDRTDAGRRLAGYLEQQGAAADIVLGIPRGAMPVAGPVGDALDAPLDIVVAQKMGAPDNPELAIGAATADRSVYRNDDLIDRLGISEEYVERERAEEAENARQKANTYRDEPPDLRGKRVVVVDDGVATGATAIACLRQVREAGASWVALAVPVGSPDSVEELRREADAVYALETPSDFRAVGQYYRDFGQVTDEEAMAYLGWRTVSGDGSVDGTGAAGEDGVFDIPADDVTLEGELIVPGSAEGIVVFAHGSGSSRHSPRNNFVAETLRDRGLGTLLFDILTEAEGRHRENRFDVPLLTDRLLAVTEWLIHRGDLHGRTVGYFGASTGAAAALRAAARRPDTGAVVSRGGRVDMAEDALDDVRAPTLFVVGGDDEDVLKLNREAYDRLPGRKDLQVVEGAGHLFEGAGELESVAALAADWFETYL